MAAVFGLVVGSWGPVEFGEQDIGCGGECNTDTCGFEGCDDKLFSGVILEGIDLLLALLVGLFGEEGERVGEG